jgi:hypothetical protein
MIAATVAQDVAEMEIADTDLDQQTPHAPQITLTACAMFAC